MTYYPRSGDFKLAYTAHRELDNPDDDDDDAVDHDNATLHNPLSRPDLEGEEEMESAVKLGSERDGLAAGSRGKMTEPLNPEGSPSVPASVTSPLSRAFQIKCHSKRLPRRDQTLMKHTHGGLQ